MQGPNPEVHAGWQLWGFFFYRQGAPYLCYMRLCMPLERGAGAPRGGELYERQTPSIIKHQIQIQPRRARPAARWSRHCTARCRSSDVQYNNKRGSQRRATDYPTNINISTVLNEVLFLRASKKERTAASERFERAETETQQHSRLRSDNRYAEWRRICAVYCLL